LKAIVVYNSKWLRFWGKDITGMTIFPFIILRNEDKQNPPLVTINHEKIHIQQQAELFLIGFPLIYYTNWLINIIKYKIKKEINIVKKGYRNILFENEAYSNQDNLDYLKTRKCYACFRKK